MEYTYDDFFREAKELEAKREKLILSGVSDMLPSGKDWNKYMCSPSILEKNDMATAYESGFKDCLIEVKKRIEKGNYR